jgi:DnaJ-class molecular chaperone
MFGKGIKIGLRGWFGRLFFVVVCLMSGVALAFQICGSCGYECADDARFCGHCGSQLKAGGAADGKQQSKADAVESDQQKDDVAAAAAPVVDVKMVAAEMREAKRYFAARQYEVASLFAHNALALNVLSDSKNAAARNEAIMKVVKSCSYAAGKKRNRCPDCDGSGRALMTKHGLSGAESGSVSTAGMTCKRCGGSGYIVGGMTVNERKYVVSRAIEQYRTLQQGRGMQPMGLVWVPESVIGKLDLQSQVVLKRAIPPLCPRCMGLGRVDCKKCNGRGVVRCQARGCHDGYVEVDSRNGRRGGSRSSGTLGSMRTICSVCHGTGLVGCQKCGNQGSFTCKECDGSGHAKICRKCHGAGLVDCRRCGGSGIYHDKTCPYCEGKGKMECSSCGGTGRRQ